MNGDGFYIFYSGRIDKYGLAQKLNNRYWLINEEGSVTIEEMNRRGWECVGEIDRPGPGGKWSGE